MKLKLKTVAVALSVMSASVAYSQYYEIANQVANMISPALSGSFNYKGYVELDGLAGIGDNRANFIGVSTTQGFRYSNWFFMGAGVGVDVAMAHREDNLSQMPPDMYPSWYEHDMAKTKVMVPVFTDFRFTLGDTSSIGGYIDIKVGAAWLMGSSYLYMNNASLSNGTQFYLRPSVGLRIPTDKTHPNRAFNVGLTYQLLTSNNNYAWHDRSVTLNNIGVTVGYEW